MADLLIWLIVGGAAGWIAGLVVKGTGFGLLAILWSEFCGRSSLAFYSQG
jgi:uncharacterized membrane protein YeaQ/YmgE (transglycosylase-associated protein family)